MEGLSKILFYFCNLVAQNLDQMKNLFILFAFTLFLTACTKEDPVVPNEEEIITTVIYTLTPKGGGTPIELKFQDLDGEGGNPGTANSATLRAGTQYDGVLRFVNESESPAEEITEEVEEESNEHQVFFKTSSTLNVSVSYADTDSDGKPLGLKSVLAANTSSTGNLTITLRHEPNKGAMGVAGGDITNAGGETDIEVSFAITVQ